MHMYVVMGLDSQAQSQCYSLISDFSIKQTLELIALNVRYPAKADIQLEMLN